MEDITEGGSCSNEDASNIKPGNDAIMVKVEVGEDDAWDSGPRDVASTSVVDVITKTEDEGQEDDSGKNISINNDQRLPRLGTGQPKTGNHNRILLHCKYCEKPCRGKDLKSHEAEHGGERPYVCTLCGKSFRIAYRLRVHKMMHTGERPHQCKYCGKAFVEKPNLKIHQRLHTGELPYQCRQCGENFKTTVQLRVHEREHSGARPYKCAHCPEAFKSMKEKYQHVRIHTGEGYECSSCGKKFGSEWGLRRHGSTHSNERPYRCEYCEKSYTQSSNLLRHKRTVHMVGTGDVRVEPM